MKISDYPLTSDLTQTLQTLVEQEGIAYRYSVFPNLTKDLPNRAVEARAIADLSITNAHLASASVGLQHFSDLSVTGIKLAGESIVNQALRDHCVGTTQLAALAVSTSNIPDSAIKTGHLADGAVTFQKLSLAVRVMLGIDIPAPTIVTNPNSQTVQQGSSVTLSVVASGSSLSYQWYQGLTGQTQTLIAGATGSVYVAVVNSDSNYWVRVSNINGSVDSTTAVIQTTPAPPFINVQPAGAALTIGDSYTLSVAASGLGLSYQWYQGTSGNTSSPVSGATSPNLILPSVTNNVSYWVRVSNITGHTDSVTANLLVSAPVAPVIISNPANTNIESGQTATLVVAATGVYLSYQWYQGLSGNTTSPISGANSSTYTTGALTAPANYWVRVSNAGGSVDSTTAAVSVNTVIVTSGPMQLLTDGTNLYSTKAGEISRLDSNGFTLQTIGGPPIGDVPAIFGNGNIYSPTTYPPNIAIFSSALSLIGSLSPTPAALPSAGNATAFGGYLYFIFKQTGTFKGIRQYSATGVATGTSISLGDQPLSITNDGTYVYMSSYSGLESKIWKLTAALSIVQMYDGVTGDLMALPGNKLFYNGGWINTVTNAINPLAVYGLGVWHAPSNRYIIASQTLNVLDYYDANMVPTGEGHTMAENISGLTLIGNTLHIATTNSLVTRQVLGT